MSSNPVYFWQDYREITPFLADFAERVLSIAPTAAGIERSQSAFGHIWNDKRSRLLSGRVAMLVYVYYNQRVLDRTNAQALMDVEEVLDYLRELDQAEAGEGDIPYSLCCPACILCTNKLVVSLHGICTNTYAAVFFR